MRKKKRSPPARRRRWRAGSRPSAACRTPSRRSITKGRSSSCCSESERVGLANVFPIGAITKGREGKELAEIGSMHERGAVAFSDDGVGVADASVMRKALQYAKMFDDGAHAALRGADALRRLRCTRGWCPRCLGLPGIPAEAEQLMIARDLLLNRTIGCRYHVQHISTAWSVELIRRAKRDGHDA